MAETERKLGEFGFAGDDHVVPFEVSALDARGRVVQLGPILDAVLARHDYPEPVARLLAESITLTVLLGTSLKFDGKFIFQTRSDGPVDMLVADFSTPGSLRGYAATNNIHTALPAAFIRLDRATVPEGSPTAPTVRTVELRPIDCTSPISRRRARCAPMRVSILKGSKPR